MPELDFIGTWAVSLTSGTPFGVDTQITISEDPNSITFVPSASRGALEMQYDQALDMLRIDGISGLDSSLYLAVYRDPEVAYRALYGVAMIGDALVTFGAAADQTPTTSSSGSTGSPVVPAPAYIVRSASGSQFGLGSRLEFVSEEEGANLTIVDIIGRRLLAPGLGWVGPTTLQGLELVNVQGRPVPLGLQCSFVEIDGRKVCFGLSVAGDPENSGVWGADEEEPPSPEPGEKR